MPLFLMFLLIFFPSMSLAQADEIILPELDLVIEDQSVLNTVSIQEATLRERNPQFQDVYLEEISTGLADVSFSRALSQKETRRIALLNASYGSFNDTKINALLQNMISNVLYKFTYQGNFRQNALFNKQEFDNTSFFQNRLQAYVDADINNSLLSFEFEYYQHTRQFISNTNHNQDTQYIPLTFKTKHWIDDKSYLDISAHSGFTILAQKNLESVITDNVLLIDGDLLLAYRANFTDKNYFEIESSYWFNDYRYFQAHTGLLNIKTDFVLGKGVSVGIGMGLVSSSENAIFGWPELSLEYQYLDYFTWNFKISGDFTLYNAELAARESQFFSLIPSPESRWIYSSTMRITPHPIFWMALDVNYSDYNAKRIYQYDIETQLYNFTSISQVDIIETGFSFGLDTGNIFNMNVAYRYQNIPKFWLLFSPHKFDVFLNLGYKPVGFNLETHFTLYAPRMLTETDQAPIALLLNLRISQKIYQTAELFIEVKNILNQNIQFISGTYYGGIQANGGITVNF
ncbi:MAG: hypothetical protein ACRCWI_07370 [Brevinema sp.]